MNEGEAETEGSSPLVDFHLPAINTTEPTHPSDPHPPTVRNASTGTNDGELHSGDDAMDGVKGDSNRTEDVKEEDLEVEDSSSPADDHTPPLESRIESLPSGGTDRGTGVHTGIGRIERCLTLVDQAVQYFIDEEGHSSGNDHDDDTGNGNDNNHDDKDDNDHGVDNSEGGEEDHKHKTDTEKGKKQIVWIRASKLLQKIIHSTTKIEFDWSSTVHRNYLFLIITTISIIPFTRNLSLFLLHKIIIVLVRPILRSLIFCLLYAKDSHFSSNLIHQIDAKLSDDQLPTIFIVKNAPQTEI
jgi:hypothetical protein